MNQIDLRKIDLNLLVTFDVLMDERSVTQAAKRLGRTQSAVSHSLSRLREQLDDPLMVKMNGRMTSSPFAERLVEDVRPILHKIQRILEPPQPFDPATSRRTFRIAISDVAPLFSRLMFKVRRGAPGVTVEWVAEEFKTPSSVAEGQVDIAFIASAIAIPEGVERVEAGKLNWATFVRRSHPAIATWGIAAWEKWPHAIVGIGNRVQSPVAEAADKATRNRTVAAQIPDFSSVPSLLAQTDLLATLPGIVMVDTLERYDLCVLPTPVPVKPMSTRFIWSSRLANDPGIRWIRLLMAETFSEVLQQANIDMAAGNTTK